MIRTSIAITTIDQIGRTGIANSQNSAFNAARTSATPALYGLRMKSRTAPVTAMTAQMMDTQPQKVRLLATRPSSGRYRLLSSAPMPQSRFDAPARLNMMAANVNQLEPAGRAWRAVVVM